MPGKATYTEVPGNAPGVVLHTWLLKREDGVIIAVSWSDVAKAEDAASVVPDVVLEACKKGVKSDANLVWAPSKFLEGQKVEPWSDMPAWIPSGTDGSGLTQVDCSKAIAKGLKFRPIRETAADTLAWWNSEPEERRTKLRAGISAEREKEVLAALRARS